ncbi:CRISPR-associated endoribonuclease Cas2 [Planctomycetes bacterium Pan216]|uniref:CRISPR-associated endoribonuclease Cas2 n=1 Tax=Kolteria novifilia TaxID=2527975 RepID=A0A518B221_9BACT|nr:CRISPR-associated endoribonuclease Cas2 [Planctomycetes bacterium Pan216]
MSESKWWLVCYDVRDPKRLRQCAKVMEGHGERVQYSVFRCWLSAREMERLRWRLTTILEPEDDTLFIPLCPRCVRGMKVTHSVTKSPEWPEEPKRHEIV